MHLEPYVVLYNEIIIGYIIIYLYMYVFIDII